MIEHKIVKETPDETCRQCAQFYGGDCRALSVPHSEKERGARTTGYGMECDDEHLKEIRWKKFGVLYRIPVGRYDMPIRGPR